MAEAALFSLASNLLSRIASPAFKKAYQRAQSIWGAREELDQLETTIEMIKAVLLDAEERQTADCSHHIKLWINRVRDVLYEADDLFDEVATNDLLVHQMKGNRLLNKVRVSFSESSSFVVSSYVIAKKVKAIRRDLDEISKDMAQFSLVHRPNEKLVANKGKRIETGWYVDPDLVIGRDDEKKVLLEFLFDESTGRWNNSVVTIASIGGMGKAALAQLVYNDVDVQQNFRNRWWVCASEIFDTEELIGRIFQSVTGKRYHGLCLSQMMHSISESISINGKFLLVLEDLWNTDHYSGLTLRSFLSGDNAKGSKIIITARTSSTAMESNMDLWLDGLSREASWELFKRLAFTQEQEKDPNWISLGKKIVQKIGCVPLIIKSIACILYEKTTMEEWNSFVDGELPRLDHSAMRALQLSYHHLKSNLKHCFAYFSLFPENYTIYKEKLVYLWIAQGYIEPTGSQTIEEAGHAYFMELSRRFFFTEIERDDNDEIVSCKIDGLIHDLARDVAGKESTMLTKKIDQLQKKIRHLSVVYESRNFILLETNNRLRSLLFMFGQPDSSLDLDHQRRKLTFLRALDLRALNMENVPTSIGELKHLRYLGLSENSFKHLPNSITKLLNLLTLDISGCLLLEALPDGFRKLISLRHLDISGCPNLYQMPPRFGELTSLQHLSDFKVSKTSRLNALVGLNLRGKLRITFDSNKGSWKTDELMLESGQIPNTVQVLRICQYPSMKIPVWWGEDPASQLVYLALESCPEVELLPPLRCLPCLKVLNLNNLDELRYIEADEFASTTPFLPSLQRLELLCLPKLEGWSARVSVTDDEEHLSVLRKLVIRDCASLKNIKLRQNALEELSISKCPNFELWGSFPNLNVLSLDEIPEVDRLPDSLRRRTALGELQIRRI